MADYTKIKITINGKEVANEIGEITKAKRELVKEINKATVGSEEYNKRVAELRNVNTTLREHRQAIGASAGAADSMVGSLKSVGVAAAAAFVTQNILQFGQELFKTAVTLDTMGRKAQTVFGGSISIVEQFADSMSSSLGLSKAKTIEAATSIGDLLIPMGFAREEAATLSTGVVKLAGAMSEWTGGQFSAAESAQSVTKALLGEREELERYGIKVSEEDVKTRLAAEGKAKLTGKALEQAKAMATLNIIMEKSVDAQTSFAQNSESLVRTQARLESALQTIKEGLAESLIPLFAGAASAIAGMIAPSKKASESTKELQINFNAQVKALESTTLSASKKKEILNQLIVQYKQYGFNLNAETASLKDIHAAQIEVNKSLTQRIALEAALEHIQEKQQNQKTQQKELDDSVIRQAKRKQLKEEYEARRITMQQYDEQMSQLITYSERWDQISSIFSKDLFSNKAVGALEAETSKQQQNQLSEIEKNANDIQYIIDFYTKKFGDDFTNKLNPSEIIASGATENAKGEKSKLEKALKELEDIYLKHQQNLEVLKVDDFSKGLLQIDQQFENEKAKLLEGKSKEEQIIIKSQEKFKQLDALRLAERDAFSKAYYEKEAADAIAAQNKKNEDAAKNNADEILQNRKFLEDKAKDKAAFEQQLLDTKNALSLKTSTPEEAFALELEIEQLKYDALLEQAKEYYGDDLTLTQEGKNALQLIEQAHAAKIQAINKAKNENIKEGNEKATQDEIRQLEARAAALSEFGNLFGALADLIADESERGAEFSKALTLFQIGLDTAAAIVRGTAEAQKLGFPANVAVTIATTAQILANVAKAKKLITSEPPKKQRFMGGFADVTGATDGRSYRAQRIGPQSTGLLNFSNPVLTASGVLANERGREYYISAKDVMNPYVMSRINDIEAYTKGTRQFAEGGMNNGVSQQDMGALLGVMLDISNKLDRLNNSATIIWDDQDTINFRKRYNDLQAASGSKYGLNV